MINNSNSPIGELKKKLILEAKILEEIISVQKSLDKADETSQKTLMPHFTSLKSYLKKIREEIIASFENLVLNSPLSQVPVSNAYSKQLPYSSLQETQTKEISESMKKEKSNLKTYTTISLEDDERDSFELEKKTVKRLKKKDKKEEKEEVKKVSNFVKAAGRRFGKLSKSLIDKGYFKAIERDLIRANMEFIPSGYLSIVIYSTLISLVASFFIFLFFLFFNLSAQLPIITLSTESLATRFIKTFWILFFVPAGIFALMYYYPSLEKKAEEQKINRELPFATIHMSAISGSMIDPSKIFKIIISTGEYPALSREFTKLLNQINIYGYDLVGALRTMAFNTPSGKLTDLFNSLATAITSGGDLPDFFEKRANSLLFEHKLEEQKQSKAAETFMDIYISVVIAAPMILMLLLMMLKIGGLGISLSTGTITIMMVLGVVIINIFFLSFLHLRQPGD